MKNLKWTSRFIILTPLFMIISLIIGGAGHGNLYLSGLFFPYTFLLAQFLPDFSFDLIYLIATINYPLYGFLYDKIQTEKTIYLISTLHLLTWLLVILIIKE